MLKPPISRLSLVISMASHAPAPKFAEVQMALPDHMNLLKKEYDADTFQEKVDLGAGVMRDEAGACYELPAIKRAKNALARQPPGHDYRPTTGIVTFRGNAAKVMFGEDSHLIRDEKIASVQTVAGTNACRIGAIFLSKHWPTTHPNANTGPVANATSVHVAGPTWPNYEPLFRHAAFADFHTYPYLKSEGDLDFDATLAELNQAADGSIFIFQGCCHNPTGRDYSRSQWEQIADVMIQKGHFAFFDTAYQGLGNSLEDDAWAVRHFATRNVSMLVAQSFSKNCGLYSERVGALHLVCDDRAIAAAVLDQLRALLRWEVSSAPAYGAELVNRILQNPDEKTAWAEELQDARSRTKSLRRRLHALLTGKYSTPSPKDGEVSGWDHLLNELGLFSFTGISPSQSRALIEKHHVYLPGNGRINVSGLNDGNIDRVARAFRDVL